MRNFDVQFESKSKECNKHKTFYETNDNCPTCKQQLSNKQEMIAENNKTDNEMQHQALEDADREIQTISRKLEKIKDIETEIRAVEIDMPSLNNQN